MRAWFTYVNNKTLAWRSWADVKAAYRSASLVGNCAVFNIGGNKYRLITRVFYRSHKVYVLKTMTHKEYDRNTWPKECGCYRNQPAGQTSNGKAIRISI